MLYQIDIKKIQNFLFENNLTIKKFALLCKISRSTAQQILNGGYVRIPTVSKISKVLGVNYADLIVK